MEPTDRKGGPRIGRWIVGGALAGGLAAGLGYVVLVFRQTSSTAPIALLATPWVAAAGVAVGAALGWSLCVLLFERPWPEGGARRWVPWLVAASLLVTVLTLLVPQAVRVLAFRRLQDPRLAARTLAASAEDALRARDYFVLSAIARNPGAPPELLLELARDDDPGLHDKREGMINIFDRDQLAVVRKVLRNPNMPDEAIPLLARSDNAYVLGDLAGDRRTPVSIVRELHRRSDSYLVHWGLTRNRNTPPEILTELAAREDLFGEWIVAKNLAGNPATPAPILERLIEHDRSQVRYGLAGNPSTPARLLEQLSADPDRSIRVRLTRNEALPFELLERLLADPDDYVRRYADQALARLGSSADTPEVTLRAMAAHSDPRLRRQAARNPGVGRERAAALADDPASEVRRALAGNPGLERELAEVLAADPEPGVRRALAGNPSLAGELLELLARDRDESVRARAAGRLAGASAPTAPD